MADVEYNIVPVQQCRSLDGWQVSKVQSHTDENQKYTVFINPWHDPESNICECKGYHYNGHCRHQLEAAAKICGWRELEGPEEQDVFEHGNQVCPRCGQSTMWVMEVVDD